MMNRILAVLLSLLIAFYPLADALAASGMVYVDCDNGVTCAGNAGAATTNSGTTDASSPTLTGTVDASNVAGTTIVLATNTNISGVAGCSAGTCDGSQAINWQNATNNTSTRKLFWITGYSGCTGSGACSVTVDTATTCTTCGAGGYAIGGRYLFPGGATAEAAIQPALRPADAVQFNASPAAKSVGYFLNLGSGSSAGFITIQGKVGVRPILSVSGANRIATLGGTDIYFKNFEFRSASSASTVAANVNGVVFDNIKFNGQGTATGGAIGSNVNARILNSEFTGYNGGDVLALSSTVPGLVFGNYIHDNPTTGAAINLSGASATAAIERNIITNNGGIGINLTGAPTIQSFSTWINHNVIYKNAGDGLKAANANYAVFLYNNIIMDNGTAGTVFNVNWTAGAVEQTGAHGYNIFSIAGGRGGGNVTGLTTNSTESTADPSFVNAAGNNYALNSGSPAIGTGNPTTWLNGSTTSFPNMGVFASQFSAGGSGGAGAFPGGGL